MHSTRRILFIVYDQFELLDLAGPSSVFNSANALLKKHAYEIHVLSTLGGLIESRTGICIKSERLNTFKVCKADTILIVGGGREAIKKASTDLRLRKWLLDNVPSAERAGSICSGALLLAISGFLDGKKATTHWADLQSLKESFPTVKVEEDTLYCLDGKVWTSAGVTTGIDMILAMVGKDYNQALTTEIARWLVVYVHRPGNQSQFGGLSQMQTDDQFSDLIVWLDKNLHQSIKVSDMAEICAMTDRTFYRKFIDKIGCTPAKFLEQRRLMRAKDILTNGKAVKSIYMNLGYQSELGFCKAFKAKYGLSPALFKRLHAQK